MAGHGSCMTLRTVFTFRRLFAVFAAAAIAGAAWPAAAHEVDSRVTRTEAAVVTLRYANGTPFAGEVYELRAAAGGPVLATGRTDARGRAVLLLEGPGPWRLRSVSADGHGLERVIDAAAGTATTAMAPANAEADAAGTADTPSRSSRLVFGFGLLLAAFGSLQLWLRRRGG